MARQCIVTKKKSVVGYTVSHSNRRTKRRVHPNLHKHRLLNPATRQYMTVMISTSGLRTLAKWETAGRKYDLRTIFR